MDESQKNYLEHHGILGQRWGKKQGPPYPLDASDHSAKEKKEGYKKSLGGGRNENLYDRHETDSKTPKTKKISKHRQNIIDNYKRKGLTQKEAEEAADKRISTEKKVAIGVGAVALTAAGIIAYKKIGANYVDQVIKQGATMQTLTFDKDRIDKGQEFYAALNKADKTNYIGRFGREANDFLTGKPKGQNKLKIETAFNKDLKIASHDRAAEEFKKLYKSDKDFKNYIHNSAEYLQNNKGYDKIMKKADYGKKELTDKQIKKLYDTYNRLLVDHREPAELNKEKFYKALKNAGYSGIVDMNDKKYSGYRSKNPLIIFADKGQVAAQKITQLDNEEINKAANIVIGKQVSRALLEQMTPVVIPTAGIAAYGAALEYDEKLVKEQKSKRRRNSK